MANLREKLNEMKEKFNESERKYIEHMINASAEYVAQVVIMETVSANFAGSDEEEYRSKVQTEDDRRTTYHEALISAVNIVNRMCGKHDLPPVYEGSNKRREYGDFAIELVAEIFNARG